MSYTGLGTTYAIAHEVKNSGDTGQIAARDIVRIDGLGRTVVAVPKGQPVPAGLAVEADEVTVPDADDAAVTPGERANRRRPQPDIGGQQRMSTRVERMFHLAGHGR